MKTVPLLPNAVEIFYFMTTCLKHEHNYFEEFLIFSANS